METTETSFSRTPNHRNVAIFDRKPVPYPTSTLFGIMIGNDSTGSQCSVAQFEPYRNATGNLAPMRKMKTSMYDPRTVDRDVSGSQHFGSLVTILSSGSAQQSCKTSATP